MIPIRETASPCLAPVATWFLLLVNAAVFCWTFFLPEGALHNVFMVFGLVPRRLVNPQWALAAHFPPGAWRSLLTYAFFHLGPLHAFLNLWFLWLFGRAVESRLGAARFLVFYFACAVAGAAAHLVAHALDVHPLVGSSAAVSGVMGAYLLLFPRARVVALIPLIVFPLFLALPAFLFMGGWLAMQVFSGVFALGGETGYAGVAWWAHVGGFVSGLVLCSWFVPVGLERKRFREEHAPPNTVYAWKGRTWDEPARDIQRRLKEARRAAAARGGKVAPVLPREKRRRGDRR